MIMIMAVRSFSSFSTVVPIKATQVDEKHQMMDKVCMAHQKHSKIPMEKPPALLIRSTIENKIFEDQSRGIICYKNERTGEVICEGYDEGPRYHEQTSNNSSGHQREAKIIEILERSWFRTVDEDHEFHQAGKGAAVAEGLDSKTLN